MAAVTNRSGEETSDTNHFILCSTMGITIGPCNNESIKKVDYVLRIKKWQAISTFPEILILFLHFITNIALDQINMDL